MLHDSPLDIVRFSYICLLVFIKYHYIITFNSCIYRQICDRNELWILVEKTYQGLVKFQFI